MIGILALLIAQSLDWITALNMAAGKREINPVAVGLVASPLAGIIAKVALVALLVATYVIVRRSRPMLARGVVFAGVLSGVIGAISNS